LPRAGHARPAPAGGSQHHPHPGGATPERDTLELTSRLVLRKVHQYMRHVGLRVEEARSVVDFLA